MSSAQRLLQTQWALLRDATDGEASIGMRTSPRGTTCQGPACGYQTTPENPAVPIQSPCHIQWIPSLFLHGSKSLPSHPPPPPAFSWVFEELLPWKTKGFRVLHSQDLFPSRTRQPGGSGAAVTPSRHGKHYPPWHEHPWGSPRVALRIST